ncbi:MAG: outer membrane protein assembly factor BamD [Syntrophales bacterium]|nr:outer membrane protein assembly factor BamD [Syntrophales bacterium]MDD5532875.1 outer membrane protein assembly factor BamD [Syntrophales bacterium]
MSRFFSSIRINPRAGRLLLAVFFLIGISGCGWFSDLFKTREPVRVTPESLYQRGVELYRKGRYDKSIEAFQRLKEEYPLSKFAIMAELGIADSYFSDDKFIEAEASYSEFINLHPTNLNLPYVIYQLGMCHFHQIMTIDRDQTETRKAKKEFERLIAQYPSSQFSFMAEKMLRECNQRLGEHEFYVGRFYFKSRKYRAALRRFEAIAREYPNIGLDYKVSYYLHETRRLLEIQEREEADKAEKAKKAQAEKAEKEKKAEAEKAEKARKKAEAEKAKTAAAKK